MTHLKFNRRGFLLNSVLPALVALTGAVGNAHADSGYFDNGRVFTATNAPAGNEIVIYHHAANGSLSTSGRVATGGQGSGGGLGNQGGLVLSKNGRWLVAVNAGSNEISVFSVRRGEHYKSIPVKEGFACVIHPDRPELRRQELVS